MNRQHWDTLRDLIARGSVGFHPRVDSPEIPAIRAAMEEIDRLRDAIAEHHAPKADDLCWMDDDALHAAAGLPPRDHRVGSQAAMLKNCRRFVRQRTEGGGPWKSYAELEMERDRLAADRAALIRLCTYIPDWSDGTERWAWAGNFSAVPFAAMEKCVTQQEAERAVLRAAGIG